MTKEVTVTYHAPKGDSKVVEAFGTTFYDGKPETVTLDDRTLAKVKGNTLFECKEGAQDHQSAAHAGKEQPGDEHHKDPPKHQHDAHKEKGGR